MSLAAALRTGDLAELPGRRDEDWRWTDLRGLIRALPPASPAVAAVARHPALAAFDAPTQIYANGLSIGSSWAHGNVSLLRRFVSATDRTAHHAEASIDVAAGGRLILVDSFEGQATGYVADSSTPIRLGAGARVERIVFLDDAADAVSVALTEVELPPARCSARRCWPPAPGASGSRRACAISAAGDRPARRRLPPDRPASVRPDHPGAAPGVDGVTAQLTKGMVADQARGVFQGRIVVEKGADRTDARMGHHALMLSDRAEVDAKPELEIWADDVACAHGATVGALDEDALFYARQRGIPEAEARAMLVEAFLAEVVERIEHEAARGLAHAWLAVRLEAAR
ncbi:MAG: SufD family Fe-S cluster assembly protein [Caulobacteraceae bacterium]